MVKHTFLLPKGQDPLTVELEDAIVLIKEKQEADAPIYIYKELTGSKRKRSFWTIYKMEQHVY